MLSSRAALVSLIALACACTTSFEADVLRERPDATVAPDAPDARPPDAPAPDLPPADVSSACGAENAPCCSTDAAASTCNAGLVCSGGVCARCPGSLAACAGSCVDITSNAAHCGRCGNPCPEGYACAAGTCRLSCAAGLEPCGSTCAQRLTDPMNCGSCGRACAATGATAACVMGVCALGRCNAGRGDCDMDPANGCEASLDSVTDCGGCRVACAPPNALVATCESGACRVGACRPGFADCDHDASNGCEVNTNTNAAHCGACETSCAAGSACEAGACRAPSTACATGSADCNGAMAGCETDVTADVMNCGACGNACTLPHASARCAVGACAVASCNAGFGDCDGMAANGCEADTRTSVEHCGGCGRACAPAHATGACAAGACQVAACEAGWADCNRDASDGCEVDLTSSAASCGACGSACAAANGVAACAMGRCAVASCSAGFADCDMNPGNGCEVDTRSSASNCGACGAVCAMPNATAACAAGRCTLGACLAGFADCDGVAANGCEVDTRSNPSSCGGCMAACAVANGTPACVAGRCAVGSCSAGFADCDANPSNGCEVDTRSSATSCGACGRACSSGQVCSDGACTSICPAGQTMCGSSCVDLMSNPAHCGACGRGCPTGANASPYCAGGACQLACNAGFADCDMNPSNGCEVDLRNNTRNCGACGRSCPSGSNSVAFCAMGSCTLSCATGYGNCDGSPADGCEVNLRDDVNNCGACGRGCSLANATSGCADAHCTIASCNRGYGNCDGYVLNGCEAAFATSEQHCGRCNNPCAVGATCVAGLCACPLGQTACGGRCTSTATDPANCGSCGHRCGSMQSCRLGMCVGG